MDRLFTPRFFVMCGFTFTVFLSAFQLLPTAPGGWIVEDHPPESVYRMWNFDFVTRPAFRRARYHADTSFMGTQRRSSLR